MIPENLIFVTYATAPNIKFVIIPHETKPPTSEEVRILAKDLEDEYS